MRPIHYLGSKLRLVDRIRSLVADVEPTGARVCDLFSGSGTVSAALAADRAVTAIDIQEYSRVLCSAVLNPQPVYNVWQEHADLLARQPINEVAHAALPLVQLESKCFDLAKAGDVEPLCRFLEEPPLSWLGERESKFGAAYIEAQSRFAKLDPRRAKIVQQFGGTYFSFSQAVQLAEIEEVINLMPKELSDTLRAALLGTASQVVNTVGKHFAQPIRIYDKQGQAKRHLIQKVLADRSMGCLTEFESWLVRYDQRLTCGRDHKAIRADYRDGLRTYAQDVGVVYADPPYTRDHYSRYYHVLETMCFPQEANQGANKRAAYRADRHQSPFCIKTQAPAAFEELFVLVRNLCVPMVLSYSPLPLSDKPRPRVLTTEQLRCIAMKFFKHVDVVTAAISHSKLNRRDLNSAKTDHGEVFFLLSN